MLVKIFAARWLGAGMALEAFLAIAAGLYAITLMTTPPELASDATTDIAYQYGACAIIPLVAKSMLTSGGVILNIFGDHRSRAMRISGAFLGAIIWCGLSVQLAYNNHIGGFFVFCLLAYVASVRIMAMAWANIPEPGLMQTYAKLYP